MKIGNPADKPPPAPVGNSPAAVASTAGKAALVPATAPATADASATVALSSTASTLLSGGSASDFDARKVAQMSAAIAGGTFKVNADAIADKLIANAQELLTQVDKR